MSGSCGFIMMGGKFVLAGSLFGYFPLCAVLLEGSGDRIWGYIWSIFWIIYTD